MIDYGLLLTSIPHYEKSGYQRIEAPWLVTKKIAYITTPSEIHMHEVVKNGKEKVFVGSGEQSFLYLINKGHLPATGKFQTITPCMRNDDFDIYHTKYFMKNELIEYFANSDLISDTMLEDKLHQMINSAMEFFAQHVPINRTDLLAKVETDIGYDIEYSGIEIGSYGIRHCPFVTWIYGTGIAEPRFSRAIGQ